MCTRWVFILIFIQIRDIFSLIFDSWSNNWYNLRSPQVKGGLYHYQEGSIAVVSIQIESIYQQILLISENIESMQYACTRPDSKMYESKLGKIRVKILDLLELTIQFLLDSHRFDLWEKNYLKKALLMFAINLHKDNSRAWLQNCLNYIYLATAKPEEEMEKEIEPDIARLQKEDFLFDIEKLRAKMLPKVVENFLK